MLTVYKFFPTRHAFSDIKNFLNETSVLPLVKVGDA